MGGAVAEYRPDLSGVILISLYPGARIARKLARTWFCRCGRICSRALRDKAQLAGQLASLFANYGPQAAGRPESIGSELLDMTRMVVRMDGGGCQMKLDAEEPSFVVQPGYKEPEPEKK